MKILKSCPVLLGVVTISSVLFIVSFAFRDTAYAQYNTGEMGSEPIISLALKGAREGIFPWNYKDMLSETGAYAASSAPEEEAGALDSDAAVNGTKESEVGAIGENPDNAAVQVSDVSGNNSISGNSNIEDSTVSGNSTSADNGLSDNEDIIYEFTEVDDDYFSDALFIGDSRTVGLSEYCAPLAERAVFYSKISLTIYDCMTKEFIKTDNGKINIDTALSENSYGKIYIMLGLNEIGTGDAKYFKDAYSGVLDRITELQPDAIIYIQGIMHVTENKSKNDKYFNNANINERNEALSELADNKRIFYIDMNEAVDDENGNLESSLSFDDVHLKASSYERWHEFLLSHAIVK